MPIKFNDKKLYSIRELAKILPITPLTIRAYLRKGKIKGHKIGKNWYVIKEDLEAFLGGVSNRSYEYPGRNYCSFI